MPLVRVDRPADHIAVVTLDRPDGVSVTVAVTTDTKVRGAASADELAVGKAAAVVSQSGTATTILQRPAA